MYFQKDVNSVWPVAPIDTSATPAPTIVNPIAIVFI
jgi:hypothetical protein